MRGASATLLWASSLAGGLLSMVVYLTRGPLSALILNRPGVVPQVEIAALFLLGKHFARKHLRASSEIKSPFLMLLASSMAFVGTRLVPGIATPVIYLAIFVTIYLAAVPLLREVAVISTGSRL